MFPDPWALIVGVMIGLTIGYCIRAVFHPEPAPVQFCRCPLSSVRPEDLDQC